MTNQIFEITDQNRQDYYRENVDKFLVLTPTGICLGSFYTKKEAKKLKREYAGVSRNPKMYQVYHVYFSDTSCLYAVELVR